MLSVTEQKQSEHLNVGFNDLNETVCIFPAFVKRHVGTVEFDRCTVRTLQNLPFHSGGIEFILSGIWAMVLGRFTEAEIPKFGLLKEKNVGSEKVFSVRIDPSKPASSLFHVQSWDIRDAQQGQNPSYNSGILIIHGSSKAGLSTAFYQTYSVSLVLRANYGGNDLSLAYKKSILSESQARYLVAGMSQAIASIALNPNLPIRKVDFCCPIQTQKVLSWQACPPLQPELPFLFQHIDKNLKERGALVAVDAWDGNFTFDELDQVSTRLAVHLQTLGAGCNTMVLTCFEKSKWAIAAMLAVNKSGSCFVPCDPACPKERLQTVVKKTKADIAVVSSLTAPILSSVEIRTIIIISDFASQISSGDGTFIVPRDYLAPAYCLFTSGSTGEAKGCEVSHVAFASVSTHVDALHLDQNSRSLQFASYAFGISLIDIWCTLIAGGLLCIPSDDDRLNNLSGFISRARITWALLTRTVLESMDPDEVGNIDILIGGEAIGERDINTWAPKVRLYQAYGLTEWSGVFAVSHRVTSPHDYGIIGTPTNGRAWVVDPSEPERLAPIGALGELVIEGPSLARGYLGDPDETQSVFISRPHWSLDMTAHDTDITNGLSLNRVYRTGDLVRYCEDSSIQYIRRKDTQVKLRGQRLELTEVEYNIKHLFPQASRVMVLVHGNTGSTNHQQNLIALIQLPNLHSNSHQSLSVSQGGVEFMGVDSAYKSQVQNLENALRLRLPQYMIPQLFLPVHSLPTTITGKADRRALGEAANKIPYEMLHRLYCPEVKPRSQATDCEKEILEAVHEALGLAREQFGMLDNFFHIGGNSGSAMKLAAHARKRGMNLSMIDVFENPVLADMASVAREHQQQETKDPTSAGLLPDDMMIELRRLAASQCELEQSQIEDIYPATALQEGLIALSAQDIRRGTVRVVCHLDPNIDVEVFKQAWETVFQSNDILRTRFIVSPSKGTFQVVTKTAEFQWNHAEDTNTYINATGGFQTGIGECLVHAHLAPAEYGEDRSLMLVLVMHHAICDRWSVRLLLEQLTRVYHKLPVPRNRFSPFIRYLMDKKMGFKDFWAKQFDNLQASVFPGFPSPNFVPGPNETLAYTMHLPRRSMKSFTAPTYLKLAWALVVSCNTGVDDIVFGIVVNGRAALVDKLEEMTGPTIATLPLRIKLAQNESVRDNLAQIQLLSTKTIPFEQAGLQEIQKYSSDAKSACMFQNQLIIHPPSQDPKELFRDCQYASASAQGLSKYGLSIACQLANDNEEWECDVTVDFDPAMVSRSRALGLVQHMELLMQQLLRNPRQRMRDLPRLSSTDLDLLSEWNSKTPPDFQDCVHTLIEAASVDNPTAPAVAAWDGGFNYQELANLSNNLAADLLRRNIEPGTFIPLLFEKSKWTTVAVLAVMKAGAAFILLDPSYPEQRLRAICRDANSKIVICSRKLVMEAEKLNESVMVIDDAAVYWETNTLSVTLPEVHPHNPVYVVYTSGSTGTPKGAVIEHHSYCAAFRAHSKSNNIDNSTRMLQFASYAFDNSIMETLSTLMAGGCVCVPSEWERHNRLVDCMQNLHITHAIFNPSTARLLQNSNFPSLRVIVMAGEVMSQADCNYWAPKVQLMNEYGIAECCVASISRRVSETDAYPRDIGFPLGVAVWVVDHRDHDLLVPIGAPGELLIEGPSVGREYLNSPEATRKAFIDPPAWLREMRQGQVSRVYKTGDMVKYSGTGSLLFLGRKDGQAKIRNQRFEVEEVEHHIRSFGVQDVVAVVATPRGGRSVPCLATFVLHPTSDPFGRGLESNTPIASFTPEFQHLAGTIKAGLQELLPDYMMPSFYLPVTKMPETRTGKIDRQRLKQEIQNRTWRELKEFTASTSPNNRPATETERKLQVIWAQVLGVLPDEIGVDDSFFHLGGDSITAMQVVAGSHDQNLDYSVQDIVRLRTISGIVNNALTTGAQSKTVIEEDVGDTPFELSPVQELFFEKYPQGAHRFVQNVLVHVRERVSVSDIERAARKLVRNHSMLRARYTQREDGTWQQNIGEYREQSFRLQVHHLDSSQEMDPAIEEAQRCIHITSGPVFAVDIFIIDENIAIFMVAHHLVMDLVSWRIIFSDMEEAIRDGQYDPSLSTSFPTWTRLQTKYSTCNLKPPPVHLIPHIDQTFMREFWGARDNSNLIADSATEIIRVDEQTTNSLFAPKNAFDAQLVDILHAAILFSFVRTFPNRPAPCIYGEAHGREPWDPSIDLSRTIGWFTTIWPVVTQIGRGDSLQAVVHSVKDARRQLPSNGWPYFTSMYRNTKSQKYSSNMDFVEITLNYGGKFQQVDQQDAFLQMESVTKMNLFNGAGELKRWAMFEVNSLVFGGCLEISLTYNRGIDKERILNPWMENMKSCLQVLATEAHQT